MGKGRTIYSWCGSLCLRARGVAVGPGLVLYGMPMVARAPGSRIVLGCHVALCSSCTHNPVGIAHPVILRTLRPGSVIEIGDDAGLSGTAVCAALSVHIGCQCLVGANVTITDSDFHSVAAGGRRHAPADRAACAPVVVEDNVWIGMNTLVLKGVRIGANSVIAAGSVVARSIPANCVAGGVPARVLRALTPAELDGCASPLPTHG